MRKPHFLLAMTLALGAGASIAPAQTIPGSGSGQGGLSGAAGGLLGGLMPNVGTSTVGNVTGVLGYCLKNKLLGGVGATSVLNGLTSRSGVTSSKDFAIGQSGILQTGNATLPLGSVEDKLRAKMCDLVLRQATKLL